MMRKTQWDLRWKAFPSVTDSVTAAVHLTSNTGYVTTTNNINSLHSIDQESFFSSKQTKSFPLSLKRTGIE